MAPKIPRALWLAPVLVYFLYFYHLGAVGLVGPDEPRYASISRAMAESGDWVTPRLLGKPWFEKPVLLYWMEGAAFRVGLSSELAPRLPVALLACGFLLFFWWMVNREFGHRPAWFAATILGTSAWWMIFAQVGTTDLPLAATYSTAMLLALPWIQRREVRLLPWVAFFLGLAVLAKGPVALVLAVPMLYPWRKPSWSTAWHDTREWVRLRVMLPFVMVTAPWYALCARRNGKQFLLDFFWKHNVERFTSAEALQHGQPFWFYVPIMIAALLPWAPLLVLAARRGLYRDPRRLYLLAAVLMGLVFFSTAANKLPGYILPLLPAAALLLGLGLDETRDASLWLAISSIFLATFLIAAPMLPAAVSAGSARAAFPPFQWYWVTPLALAPAVWLLERRGRRLAAVLVVASGTAAGMVYLKSNIAPDLDRIASARWIWRQVAPQQASICAGFITRGMQYSLEYYAGKELPGCTENPRPLEIRQTPGQAPALYPGAAR